MPDTQMFTSPGSLVPPARRAGLALAVGTALTLAASALMVFWVQPLISRLALPVLGGAPNVWNTCSLFFQACLLAGYAYAHLLTSVARPRAQVAVHAALLVAAGLTLPIGLDLAQPPDPDGSPVLWLLAHLAMGAGLPFVMLSATAPLLQRWFSYSHHKDAADPYFLYAASNAGSLAALISYPTIVERLLGLSAQSMVWSAGYALVALCVIGTGAVIARDPVARPAAVARSAPIAARTYLRWLALAFVPSGLMLATTTHITTNIASAPLLWIIPLTLYIGTFVLAFGAGARAPSRTLLRVQALAVGGALIALALTLRSSVLLLVPLTAFGLTALVCHRQLAALRPPTDRLTAFYLVIAAGGVLGGAFTSILAPLAFPDVWEYPLLLVAACAVRPLLAATRPFGTLQMLQSFTPVALTIGGAILTQFFKWTAGTEVLAIAAALAFAAVAGRPARATIAAGLLASLVFTPALQSGHMYSARSFFGSYTVVALHDQDVVSFRHGDTLHNAESTRPGESLEPLTYYARGGPFDRVMGAPGITRIGAVGLGIGALACDVRPGQSMTFYEIDPLVASIARDPRFFHQMRGCGDPPVIIGDARLSLARATDGAYDLLIIDAFSSDAVPMHLLTREAMALYWRKLAPGGTLLMHISNGYLDLRPAIAALARDAGLAARTNIVAATSSVRTSKTLVAIMTRDPARLDEVAPVPDWIPLPPPLDPVWTDDRANVLQVLRIGGSLR